MLRISRTGAFNIFHTSFENILVLPQGTSRLRSKLLIQYPRLLRISPFSTFICILLSSISSVYLSTTRKAPSRMNWPSQSVSQSSYPLCPDIPVPILISLWVQPSNYSMRYVENTREVVSSTCPLSSINVYLWVNISHSMFLVLTISSIPWTGSSVMQLSPKRSRIVWGIYHSKQESLR